MTIHFGRALIGLTPLSVKTANDVYRGDVLLSDGKVYRGFVKDLGVRQLANELLVATLAHGLGIRVPRVALIAVGNEVSTQFSKVRHSNGKDFLGFCSIDAEGATVHQIIVAGKSGQAFQRLKKAPDMGRMYGFDTWVANIDRHMNNIIISGDGFSYLIDHGHCFSGPNWKKADLHADLEYANKLALWLTPTLNDAEKSAAMADVHALVGQMASTDVQKAIHDAMAETLYGDEDTAALTSFLTGRIGHVSTISATSLGTLV